MTYSGAYQKGVETVRAKGAQAFRDGKSEDDCPYTDIRTTRGAITYSRHWRRLWLEGFRRAARK